MMAGQGNAAGAMAALEKLCQAYWYPLYAFCRRHGCSPADGEDLTQQFFAGFLKQDAFAVASPERGRFRGFLLASFKHFLTNEHHRRLAIKRGGRIRFVSLNDTDLETHFRNEPVDDWTPEDQYDRAWAMTLLRNVMAGLMAEYESAGKAGVFAALQGFLTGDTCDVTYEEIGAGLGMSESAVKMAVLRLRQRYGQKLRQEIARTLKDPSAVEEEWRHLAQALARR